MARNTARPLSPHLTIWRWGPHMLVSILHRATGVALSIGGLILLTWWLLALATGSDAYGTFAFAAAHPVGKLVLIGLTWSFFQHTLSGIRHLIMDTGAGFELGVNKAMAMATLVVSALMTVALWGYLLLGAGA
ncbi:succinate dehydrogenase, cytochrome b556 subunit [Sphingomonas ginkgonis]|uniref:Succinate dehydrogenase cytochrome b556 subunit n=1 Tax=Sphingomonas ginkgonis TaxID=2315330 RepID=A0A3R9WMJ4_9SPHN|nr:succinate dehydrogenase, cytochrome b556 subunit [Sphingomonas ginkgonis]RST29956.1 succinate dehydrogenase, cytochrome b556 subunit [Sphingomonas ginkgonis]